MRCTSTSLSLSLSAHSVQSVRVHLNWEPVELYSPRAAESRRTQQQCWRLTQADQTNSGRPRPLPRRELCVTLAPHTK